MNLLCSLKTPFLRIGDKGNLSTCDYCHRGIYLKNPAEKKAGIRMEGRWYCSSRCFTRAAEEVLESLLNARSFRTHTPRMPLGLVLVRQGLLSEDLFRKYVKMHKETGVEFTDLLVQDHVLREEQVAAAKASQWGCPVFDASYSSMPVGLTVPQILAEANGAAPLHYVASTKTLLVGFVRAVEYGFLYAAETVLGCKTTACIVPQSSYRKISEMRMRQLESGESMRSMEVTIDCARNPVDMARTLCKMSVEFEADEAVVSKCKDYVWARLKNVEKEVDLLFTAS